ncbi:unnamed protein product [Allacma fusca]|uniref:Proteasome activator complex subunit 3 n=1 Tax=Allacma fusca TaxID=39272 RepID=A0A8J2LPB2_9HEXA|nr:unnamed protein product [Allacma fusca]
MSRNSFMSNPQIEEYITTVKQKSEALVKSIFPSKILELNALLDSNDFNIKDVKSLHQTLNIPVPDTLAVNRGLTNCVDHGAASPGKKRKLHEALNNGDSDSVAPLGTKVYALTSGPVPCNGKITALIDIVKPHIRQLVEDANLLKMWITFLIPKIEDGNNFGVSIQEDTLGEIRTVEAEAATFYEQISRYFITRGKIISKVAKYPHVEDYRKLISELDEKEFLSLRIVLSEVRNHYATLYDLITKNMEKIIKPRSSNAENLY